ncbi:MAG: dTMP kinase [Betaproteobacteria bacterium]|jgi:dTMP kinase
MSGARFITFEGLDGAGKSTQLATLAQALHARGIVVEVTREPGGTPLAESIRELVLRQDMGLEAETLLIFAARAEHLARRILPALAAGRWVLCDRFTDATYAYQCGGRGLAEEAIAVLEQWVHPQLQPDATFLFDVAPAIAAGRRGAVRAADRFESEQLAFFERVRAMYLRRAAAQPQRFIVLDAAAPAAEVGAQMLRACEPWLR